MNQRIAHVDASKRLILGVYIYGPNYVPTAGQMLESAALAAGYTYAPPAPPPVPDSVEPWKLRAALGRRGLVEQIDAFIAAQPEPPRIRLLAAWEYVANPIPRRSHFVQAVTAGLRLAEAEVDAIFVEAGQIQDA